MLALLIGDLSCMYLGLRMMDNNSIAPESQAYIKLEFILTFTMWLIKSTNIKMSFRIL